MAEIDRAEEAREVERYRAGKNSESRRQGSGHKFGTLGDMLKHKKR